MFLRKFLNGHISPLTMSGAGEPAGGGAGGAAPAAEAPAAAAPAAAAPAAGGDKAWAFPTEKSFAEYLPDAYKADPNFVDIKNFDGLLSRFVNANKMIGADKATLVQIPKDDDAKAQGEFYNKLGRPETADKYAIGKRADGADYSETDKAFQAQLLPVLHQAGLTQKQLDTIRPAWDAMMGEAAGSATKAAETYANEQQGKLKTQLGATYDEAMGDAQAAVQHYGDKDVIAELNIIKDGKATGDNAGLLLMLAKMGKQLREDGIVKGGGTPPSGALSPSEAKQQIAALMADDKFVAVWRNKEAPGHAEAVAKRSALFEFAYPEERAG